MKLAGMIVKLVLIAVYTGICTPASAESVMQPGGWKMDMKVTSHDRDAERNVETNFSPQLLAPLPVAPRKIYVKIY